MKCPACLEHDLKRIPYEKFHVQFCPGCQGHLVALKRLKVIQRDRGKSPEQLMHEASLTEWQESDEGRKCPRCFQQMDVKAVPPPAAFNLEICHRCELAWFDGTELARYQLSKESRELDRKKTQAADAASADAPAKPEYRRYGPDYEPVDEPDLLSSLGYMLREIFRG